MVAETWADGQGFDGRHRRLAALIRGEDDPTLGSISPVNPITTSIPTKTRGEKLSEAKRMAAIRRFEEQVAIPPKGQESELVFVRVGDVQFDERYQSPERYDEKRARKMAAEWDWDQEVPITINIRPGDPKVTVWCPDGRHRTNAVLFRFGPDRRVKAILHRLPYEGEAAIFKHQDDNRKRVSVALKFNAGKQAGESIDIEIQALVDRLGITLGHGGRVRGVAANTFIYLCQSKGLDVVEHAMRLILDRWDGSTESMNAPVVKGVVFFVARYRNDPRYKPSFVGVAWAHESVARLYEEASKFRVSGEHMRIALALRALYNRKRMSNRLPEWSSR